VDRLLDEHAREQAELTGDLAAAWSKLEGYTARLALVIHLVRAVTGDADPMAVDAESIIAGATLSRWFGREAERVYAMLGESDEQRERRELVELIERRGGTITVRELMRSSRRYRDSAETAEAALQSLVRDGGALREPIGTTQRGGQPTARYRLVTVVTGDSTRGNTANNGVASPSPVSPCDSDMREEAEWTG
jgi:hypothetical protein